MPHGPSQRSQNSIEFRFGHPLSNVVSRFRENMSYNLPALFDLGDLEFTLDASDLLYLRRQVNHLPILEEGLDPVEQGNGDYVKLETHPGSPKPMFAHQTRESFERWCLDAFQGCFSDGPFIALLDE